MTTHCRVLNVDSRRPASIPRFPFRILQSQRDCGLQPRVGELASLPWVGRRSNLNPETVPPHSSFRPIVFFLTGNLTPSNGLPNGSDFSKYLKTRKVYGLTGFLAFFSGTPWRRTLHSSITNTTAILEAPFVTSAVTPLVTGLLRVRPQFRSHFTDVLRVLRLRRGERGASMPLQMLTFPFSLSARPALTLYSTENSEEP